MNNRIRVNADSARWAAIVAIVALLLTGFSQTSRTQEAEATFPGSNNRLIAFTTGNPPNIWTMNPDGTQRALIYGPRENVGGQGSINSTPRWSPDGKKLAFSNPSFGIYVANADGSDLTLIKGTGTNARQPSWSPDGTKILFVQWSVADDTSVISAMDADGGNESNVVTAPSPGKDAISPVWSPDGQTIAFIANEGTGDDIFTVGTDGKGLKNITNSPELGEYSLDWSPDGQTLLTGTQINLGAEDAWLVSADGSLRSKFLVGGHNPSWSPDGTKVTYNYNGGEIWVADKDGTNGKMIATGTNNNRPAWGGLTPTKVEFTQAIQELQTIPNLLSDLEGDKKPPVPMVVGKPAAVRVYFEEVDAGVARTVELSGVATRKTTVGLNPGCDVNKRRKQEAGCLSADLYFTPPKGVWTATIKIREADVLLNEYEFTMESVDTPAFGVTYLPVCVSLIAGASPTCPSNYITGEAVELIRRSYPVAPSDFSYRRLPVPTLDLNEPISTKTAKSDLLADLRLRWELLSLGSFTTALSGDQLAGWLPPGGSPGLAGTSDPVWLGRSGRVSFQVDGSATLPMDTQHTLAHEVGHNLGLRHTSKPDACGASDNSTDWPYDDSTIQEVGFDVEDKEAKPETKKDLMSYCSKPEGNNWISPFTYNKLIDGGFQPQRLANPSGAADRYLVIKGTAKADGSAGSIDEAFAIESAIAADLPNALGNHCLYLTGGAQIDYCFSLTFTEHRSNEPLDEESFVLRVPLPPGTANAYLMRGSDELATLELSASAPTVEITEPQAGAEWTSEQTIRWSASDADGDPMSFAILYSPDAGDNWLPIYVGSDHEFTFDTGDLTGDEIMIRVLASDGLNTSEDIVESIPLSHAIKGDVDCDGDVDSVDALKGLQHTAGIPVTQPGGCPPIGSSDAGAIFGDVDCDDDVDSVDSLSVLRNVAGLVANLPPGCKPIGV